MNFTKLTAFLNTLDAWGNVGFDCMIRQGGKEIYRYLHGFADRENGKPIREDTIYKMFSMTKPMTCVAALQLYEEGKFLMTDPVSKYLPEFANMMVRTTVDGVCTLRPAKTEITVQHLFTHTAGFTYDLHSTSLDKLMEETNYCYTTRQFVAAIAKEPLIYDPGTQWQYSLAHDVLGAFVEVVSGAEFETYLQENIIKPLGMKDAHFIVPEEKIGRCALRYEHDETGKTWPQEPKLYNAYQVSPNYRSGGAGLSCTTEDYMKFADTLCNLGKSRENGTRILGTETVQLMRRNHLNPAQMVNFNWIQYVGYGYGLGVRTLVAPEVANAMTGLGEFGWGGAAGTYAIIDPAHDLTILFSQQSQPAGEDYIQPRIRNIVLRCLEED